MQTRLATTALWLAWALLAPAAGADSIPSRAIHVATAYGDIDLVSEILDSDPDLWTFEYTLSGNYEPIPGLTNGISSLQIFFGGLVAISDQMGPGWIENSTGASPPFGAGWDLPSSLGPGVGPGSGPVVFSFTVPAGTAYTDAPEGSYAASSYLDDPFAPVALVDAASGLGPYVPVPEPGAAALVAGGAALLAGARRRS